LRSRYRWRSSAPYLVVVFVALMSLIGLLPRPAEGAPGGSTDYVVVTGAAGLRWDDVNPTDTPTLWKLAENGSVGAMSVRSARRPTCPGDGWLTLGAGNFAQFNGGRTENACGALNLDLSNSFLPDGDRQRIVDLNQDQPWDARPGALAESMRCTTSVGPGAALAAARSFGRIDRYSAQLPADAAGALAGCVLSVIDLGTVAGTGPGRTAAAKAVDAKLAAVLAARPPNSLLLVGGVADTDVTARLHVAIADGTGYEHGLLTSSSTSRPGYVQLTDVAPTALSGLGRPVPAKLFPGGVMRPGPGRPSTLPATLDRLVDADREARSQRPVSARFYLVLALCELVLFAGAVPLLIKARRPAGPVTPTPNPAWYEHSVEILLVAAALTVPAALLAGLVPWWRASLPGTVFGLVTLAVTAVGTIAVRVTRLGRRFLGPLGGVSALAAVVIAVDLLTGSRLQLNSVIGYSAVAGIQYAGVATVGLGVFIAGLLVGAGCLAQHVLPRWRPVVIAVFGGFGVILIGNPYLGGDSAGAVALTAGLCVTAALSSGGWLTFSRVAWALLAGVGVTGAFALVDFSRPENQRGGLGRFLGHLSDGTARLVLHPIESDNVVMALTSPLTLLVGGAGALLFFALLRPWGGLKRLFGLYPSVRAGMFGAAVATLVAGPMDGVGFNVAGGAVATVVPLAVLAALRVLRHADDRTIAVTIDPVQVGPGAAAAVPEKLDGTGAPAPTQRNAAETAPA
jgi:hypothetical protein